MHTLVVTLPWPSKELSPNSRCHWAQKARIVKRCRFIAGIHTREALGKNWFQIVPEKVKRVDVELIFTPRDNRARDEDNLIASMKPYMDGIAQSIYVNDKRFHYKEITITKPKRPPFVSALIHIIEEEDVRN